MVATKQASPSKPVRRELPLDTDVALNALATPATEPSRLADLCRTALGVDAVIFWTRRGQQLRTFAISPASLHDVSVDMRVGRGVAGHAARAGKTIIVLDMLDRAEMHAKGFELQHSSVVEAHGWRAGMFVPVHSGRRMVGVFGAYSKSPGALRPGLQADVFGAFANRVASELHRDAIAEEFDRVTALGFAAIDRAHSIDNLVFALQGTVDRLQTLYKRRLKSYPEFATPEIKNALVGIVEQSSQIGSNFEALIHQDRMHGSTKTRMQPIAGILEAAVSRHIANAESKSIDLTLQCQPNVVAFVRQHDLGRVIENLIINAIHFHPYRGAVSDRYIKVSASSRESPRSTTIVVEDNGPGIPDDELQYVFELMWASPGYGGSGFGLFFARRVIEAFGGIIEVESTPFHQTRFTIELNR
jgi:signal transduction histidine kinase